MASLAVPGEYNNRDWGWSFMHRSMGTLVLAIGLAFLGCARAQAAESLIQFNIPAQSLESALLAFSRQAHVQVSAAGADIGTLKTPGLVGTLSAPAALEQLLTGSGLKVDPVGQSSFALTKRARATSIVAAPALVPAASSNASNAPTRAQSVEAVTQDNSKKNLNDSSGPAPVTAKPATNSLEEITITGTHIRGVSPDSSPVTIYARQDIERLGVSNVEQLLRKLPQNLGNVDGSTAFAGANNDLVGSSNNTNGSTVNLHGLGAGATLVLVNGRRLAPSGFEGAFFDTSSIPLSAVERVEILTDGGSAIYGADAVAGVVNFVLRQDFDGAETNLKYGTTTAGGGEQRVASQTFGRSWGSGNAMLSYTYQKEEPYTVGQRPYLTDAAGSITLGPQQRESSAVISASQRLSSTTRLWGDALLSERTFRQSLSQQIGTGFGFRNDSSGTAKGAAGALHLSQDLADTWRAEVSAAYSQSTGRLNSLDTLEDSSQFSFADETVNKLRSMDFDVEGPLYSLPGGTMRLSLGGATRAEDFSDSAGDPALAATRTTLSRSIRSVFAEAFIPLAGASNARAGLSRLELSLAVRTDRYSDVGSSTNPKIGLLWSPLEGLSLRASHSTAFRVPPLGLLSDNGLRYDALAVPDPGAASGSTIVLFANSTGNSALRPETSRNFTIGLDIKPQWVPNLTASLTYFDIRYRNRIAAPCADFFTIFTSCAAAAIPFLASPPDPTFVDDVFNRGLVDDLVGGLTAADIQAYFDGRLHNLSVMRTSGVDFSGSYQLQLERSKFELFLNSSYLIDQSVRTRSDSSSVNVLDTIFNPVALRAHTGATWSRGHFASTFAVNYTNHYVDNRAVPSIPIGSWTTLDLQVSYELPVKTGTHNLLAGLALVCNAENFADARPPRVASDGSLNAIGIDGVNASARGRFLSLELRKKW